MVVQVIVWFAIFIGLIVIEALTADVLTVWFMPGALICIILAAFKVPLPVQIVVFFVASITMFILSKTALKKFFVTKNKEGELFMSLLAFDGKHQIFSKLQRTGETVSKFVADGKKARQKNKVRCTPKRYTAFFP